MMHIDDEVPRKANCRARIKGRHVRRGSRESAREIRGRRDGRGGGSHEQRAAREAAESPKREAEHASGSTPSPHLPPRLSRK